LARGLASNSTLNELCIPDTDEDIDPSITESGWHVLFSALCSPMCRLEKLELKSSNVNDASTLSLSSSLRQSSNLKTLDLSSTSHITIAGWREIFQPLLTTLCILECLILDGNRLDNDAMTCLANALGNNSRMRELYLNGNPDATAAGWVAFSSFLMNPNSSLEKLHLLGTHLMHGIQMNDNVIVSSAWALANNNKLKELLCDGFRQRVPFNSYAAFTRVQCNSSSILHTYRSNHTLVKLCTNDVEHKLSDDIRSLLQINREKIQGQAARLKIIQMHFGGSNINIQPFTEMDLNFMPVAISWMAQDDNYHGRCINVFGPRWHICLM
jgi:hypothetical protein